MIWYKLKNFIRIHLLALVAALFLAGVTVLTFLETYYKVEERNQALFKMRAENAKSVIEKRVKDYIQILKGAQGLFMVADSVSQEEWATYIKTLHVDENYPGILGIGFTQLVEQQQLSTFEARVRRSGYPDFKVWPENPREEYTSILFLEPFNERNRRAFGYDMFTDSTRKLAMQRARDTGRPALSGMVKLVQETAVGVQNGFLIYLPLYDKVVDPGTVSARRDSLTGYIYSPFRVNDLMQGILRSRFTDLGIEIYDGSQVQQNQLLYDSDTTFSNDEASRDELFKLSPIQLGGHTWLLYISALPGFGYETTFPWFILGGGALVSLLIFGIMFSLTNTRRSVYLKQVITDNATAALFILNKQDYCTFANPAAEKLTGFTFEEFKNNTLHSLIHHSYPDGRAYPPEECPINIALLQNASIYNQESLIIRKDGQYIPVSINAQPIFEERQIVSHLLEVRDISMQKHVEVKLRDKNKNLETLNNIGKNLAAELDIQKLLQLVTDSCTELTGAEFGAFFYNTKNEKGETLMLHTISGVSPEAFAHLEMPRATAVFSPTFHGEGIIRSADITKDQRYGKNSPFKGMPNGHLPVVSYLAVPVISRTGEVLGGLFFGHSRQGMFSESAEEIVKGIAAQAAIAIDNSRLFETTLHKNEELLKINNDLDNFVYIASHDLKAPVLNIEGLVHALRVSIEKNRPERVQEILEKINYSIGKFKETIGALTEVAKANKNLEEDDEVIHLGELLEDVLHEIQEPIAKTGARIETAVSCPAIAYSKAGMRSIIHNLVLNAIKYRSPERVPEVLVSCLKEENGVQISVTDNGLGIAENHLPKIFTMFKRYHTHIEGTGIGLYLVKRIVENKGGTISVQSKVGEGSRFTVFLPLAVKEA